MSEQLLKWDYDGQDTWTASSVLNDEGVPFEWRVEVLEDGGFIVCDSCDELLNGTHDVYWTLKDAKLYCEGRERELREMAKLDGSLQKALAEPLTFEWDVDDGMWVATSAVRHPRYPYRWFINVNHDGTFGVEHSSPELLYVDPPEFMTFSEAEGWCNQRELVLLAKQVPLPPTLVAEDQRIRELEKLLEERTKLAVKLLACVNREMYPCMVEQARKELQS